MRHQPAHHRRDMGDRYLPPNGTKNWITNGTTASVYLVIAQTSPS
jgi:alkylation response protein AidB-like acyl-CoA dehydrogenase